jgi:hypothetical protein
VRTTCLLLLATTITAALAAACGGSSRASDWCGDVSRSDRAFDTDQALDPDALAEFGRLADAAPPAVRAEARVVRRDVVLFLRNDPEVTKDADRVAGLLAAIERLDGYLRDECGVEIPTRGGSS